MRIFLTILFAVTSFIFLFIQANAQYMEVNLTYPDSAFGLNVIQNRTFLINATVTCFGVGGCGDVNGTILYNSSTNQPDTYIDTLYSARPFFIDENLPSSMKQCPSNPIGDQQFCNVTWIINATGDTGTNWKIGVFFNSSLGPLVLDNQTDNITISIIPCTVDYTMHWASIDFGPLNPNTQKNPAPGNTENQYNITVNNGSCTTDFYINSTDLRNVTIPKNVSVGNLSWSNISSNIADGLFDMDYVPKIFKKAAVEPQNVTTWYWVDMPPVFYGIYNATIFITGVVSGFSP